ncbi:MAG: mannose-1-phosphate guanylyltransferase/mannose-6-phosphate isomerase [Proteobacteria bacterium]|nr:mannose-1-phosphate guanylyltransferase/mannose-6-phosphate isomerase [Pseudomonadota bacterium]
MIIPVILAGGSGTRLWPLSRELYPKQLLRLVDDKTMIQNTYLRLRHYEGMGPPIVICNNEHRFMVAEQFRQIEIRPDEIILEPVGRNTAPALAVAVLKSLYLYDTDPILFVLPADHIIENTSVFHDAIQTGEYYALKDYLITFGIVPVQPETGYGYIKKGKGIKKPGGNDNEAFEIKKFVEKPDLNTARKYLQSGDYCWNSGMFMFKASKVLEELKAFVPDIVTHCEDAIQNGENDLDFFRLNKDIFESCPSDSIDYAIMEKTDRGIMVPLDAGWNDIGSWDALWQVGKKDSSNNVIRGDVIIHDVKTSYLHANDKLIAAVGLENLIVVETSDAVLISPKERVQDVKHLVNQLKLKEREETKSHKKVYRPWGSYENMDISDKFLVKRVTVKPGEKISLQKHFHRAEHWVVVSGTALVSKEDESFLLKEDQSTYIPLGVIHRLENPGQIPLELIEIRTGSYLGEDDIVRFEDKYGR